jgi:hypothetical protein
VTRERDEFDVAPALATSPYWTQAERDAFVAGGVRPRQATLFDSLHSSTRLHMATRAQKPRTLPVRDNKWYGRRADLPDPRDYLFAGVHPTMAAAPLPSAVDLRAGLPPCWDQGQLGSCVGNGVAAAYAWAQRRQTHRAAFKPARLFIYYGARQIEGSITSDAGCEIRDGIKVVATLGAPHETLQRYKVEQFAKKPSAKAYADGLKHQAIQYARVDNDGSSREICQALAGFLPVVMGFTVFSSFEGDDVTKTGIVPLPEQHEPVLGGHCMLIVGYERNEADGTLTFLCRNSWGTSWGDNGHCYMPEEYLIDSQLASDFWVISSVEK